MCFFKVKMPKAINPQLPAPTVTETTAPEPQAPVFGGGADSIAKETSKSGVRGLKVPKAPSAERVATTTGATASGLNTYRG